MNYLCSHDDEFIVDLKQYLKENPFDPLDESCTTPSNRNPLAAIHTRDLNLAKIQCDKCGKINNVGNHNRWHGDNCGVKQTHSEETKRKISESNKGRPLSENARVAAIESNKKRKGKKYPNGYKKKIIFSLLDDPS